MYNIMINLYSEARSISCLRAGSNQPCFDRKLKKKIKKELEISTLKKVN